MKTIFNSAPRPTNEIESFRKMTKLFNTNTSESIFIKEVHSTPGYIKYQSKYANRLKKKEIADLLIITHNNNNNEIRICFLQAKIKNRLYRKPFIRFEGDLYQWELLKDRPDIIDTFNNNFPTNILNFNTSYKSITSFGLFYKDRNGDLDFLYTIPEFLKPKKYDKEAVSLKLKNKINCPHTTCPCIKSSSSSEEVLESCTMDAFEENVLNNKIGAPVTEDILNKFIIPLFMDVLLNSLKDKPNEKKQFERVIDQMGINILEPNIDFVSKKIKHPNLMIISTNCQINAKS